MKNFTTQEIMGLLNQVMVEEISFTRMVEIMNERIYWQERSIDKLKLTTEEEKQKLFDALAKEGKRWNAEKKCIEDISTELKNGDFVAGFGCVFILHTQIDKYSAQYHALYAKTNGNLYYYRTYSQSSNIHNLRRASEEEKQGLFDALAEKGKRWNAEKLCIDNIQVRKFKVGDKVRIKHGVSSKNHDSIRPYFVYSMDELIGKELTVEYCDNSEIVICDGYSFLKEWLEPYEELKKGDLAIFWNSYPWEARVGVYNQFYHDSSFPHEDHIGYSFKNVIKFKSKEQYERVLKGEI